MKRARVRTAVVVVWVLGVVAGRAIATVTGTPATETPTPTPTETPFPFIRLGTATGIPGERVTFDATLTTDGALVVSFQNDFEFDSVRTPIGVLDGGAPACTINAALQLEPLFVFRPSGCNGAACDSVRGTGISLQLIPDSGRLRAVHVSGQHRAGRAGR